MRAASAQGRNGTDLAGLGYPPEGVKTERFGATGGIPS